jgi:hypothetical protein
MNTTHADELLARYLDGALSDVEHQEFQHLVQSNPEFAQDVRELHTVQDLLTSKSEHQAAAVTKAAHFLSNVENNLAAIVAGAGAAAGIGTAAALASKSAGGAASGLGAAAGAVSTGAASSVASGAASGISSFIASVTSSWVGIAAAGATVVGGAGAVYYAATKAPSTPPSNSTPAPLVKSVEPPSRLAPNNSLARGSQGQSQAGSQQEQQEQQPQAQGVAPAERVEGTSLAPEKIAESKTRPEYSARIKSGNADAKYAAMISDYERQLRAKDAQGDKASAALLAKSLGSLYRSTGRLQDARTQLQRSLGDARALGLRELEGESLGELALVDAAEGKKAQAITRLREAVQILTTLKGESASQNANRWQQELARLEKQQSENYDAPSSKGKKASAEREAGPRFRAPHE